MPDCKVHRLNSDKIIITCNAQHLFVLYWEGTGLFSFILNYESRNKPQVELNPVSETTTVVVVSLPPAHTPPWMKCKSSVGLTTPRNMLLVPIYTTG